MTVEPPDMSTDAAWEEWGRHDPYFGVITDPRYRRSCITEDLKRDFFESGTLYSQNLLATIRKHVDPEFKPISVLEFGCGVGRLLLPFAAIAETVVGVDVSPSMLLEAKRNCDERQLRNVTLLAGDDELSTLTGQFDLIHSYIVFQHIPIERGRKIFARLLEHLRPGSVAALHLTYSKTRFAPTHGMAPPARRSRSPSPKPSPPNADPEIQMNPYNINEILFALQSKGFRRIHIEFTDHGGELGVFVFSSVARSDLAPTAF